MGKKNVRIYLCTDIDYQVISLVGIKHKVYIESCHLDEQIIAGEMEGVHYIDTIEDNDKKYLLVHGDDYVPNTKAKSARK